MTRADDVTEANRAILRAAYSAQARMMARKILVLRASGATADAETLTRQRDEYVRVARRLLDQYT